jgi:AbrB family looped-hinge helix DNA binding protein
MAAKITSKGQVTLPKTVREHLGVEQGDLVDFPIDSDGVVRIQPLFGSVADLAGMLKRPPGKPPATLEDMDKAIASGVIRRTQRALRQND